MVQSSTCEPVNGRVSAADSGGDDGTGRFQDLRVFAGV